MSELPPPSIEIHDGYTIANDYSISTKFRMAVEWTRRSMKEDFFYATLHTGNSPEALAKACEMAGKNLTLITPEIDHSSVPMALAKAQCHGATILDYHVDNFDVISDMARLMAVEQFGELIDFDNEDSIQLLAGIARSLDLNPRLVCSAGGKGAMSRAWQLAWPKADHIVVDVLGYSKADFGRAMVIKAEEPAHMPADATPPFECNPYWEGKAFSVMKKHINPSQDVLFWNP